MGFEILLSLAKIQIIRYNLMVKENVYRYSSKLFSETMFYKL